MTAPALVPRWAGNDHRTGPNRLHSDGFGTSIALAGVAGYRRPPPGALVGGVVAGGTSGLIATFTATGGTPNLAHVSAGAGKVVIDFIEV